MSKIAKIEDKGCGMDKWIRVEDKLPDTTICSERVLIVRDCGVGTLASIDTSFMWADKFVRDEKWDRQERLGYRVTHWMPLPELPEN